MNIAIWGAGRFGSSLYKHITENRKDYNITGLFDIEPSKIRCENIPEGMTVQSAEKIRQEYEKGYFQAVLVGIRNIHDKDDVEVALYSMNIPVVPLNEFMDDIFQQARYPEYSAILSHMEDEQSERYFKTRLLIMDGIEKPFLTEVAADNKGCKYYSSEISQMKRDFDTENGVILLGLDQDADVNKTALELLGIKIRAYCALTQNNNPFLCRNNISPSDVILPEELTLPEYINSPVLISSSKEREALYSRLEELSIPMSRIFDRRESYRAVIAAVRREQYFDVWKPAEHEVYVDCGAYDGQSVLDFYSWCSGKYDRIFALEPVESQYALIKERCRDCHDLAVITAAVWDKNEDLKFALMDDLSASSAVWNENGRRITTVKGVALDDIINERVTLIKMDVEGSELNAINGAERLIKTWKPRLAISIYHRNIDVYSIPVRLLELVPEYRFLIRHYGTGLYETVLFASTDGQDFDIRT